ncbi:hypothetical protein Vafri_7684 [Volvox africanus]|uniref:Uncharacterized protein n=1 Tax=Volvox africanus TaxID=51714 RepID=A0A8J4EY02_9CHLO|nr:hypothetical protein Vafri_7684 [Volvox africanus]
MSMRIVLRNSERKWRGKAYVIDCLGRDEPMEMWLDLPERITTRARVLPQVVQAMKSQFDPETELLHIADFSWGFDSETFKIVTTEEIYCRPYMVPEVPYFIIFRTEHHPGVKRPAMVYGVPEYQQPNGSGGSFPTWAVMQMWQMKAPAPGCSLPFHKLVGLPMMVPLTVGDKNCHAVLTALQRGIEPYLKELPDRRSLPTVVKMPVRPYGLDPHGPIQERAVSLPLSEATRPEWALTWPNQGPVPLLTAITAPIPMKMIPLEAFCYDAYGLYDHRPWTPDETECMGLAVASTGRGCNVPCPIVKTSASVEAIHDPCTSTPLADVQHRTGPMSRKRRFEEMEAGQQGLAGRERVVVATEVAVVTVDGAAGAVGEAAVDAGVDVESEAEAEEGQGEERVTRQRVANAPDGKPVSVFRGRRPQPRAASVMKVWARGIMARAVPAVAVAAVATGGFSLGAAVCEVMLAEGMTGWQLA